MTKKYWLGVLLALSFAATAYASHAFCGIWDEKNDGLFQYQLRFDNGNWELWYIWLGEEYPMSKGTFTVGNGVITLTETHIHSSNLAYFATDAGWSSRSEKVELAALIIKAFFEEIPPFDGYLLDELDELHTDSVLGLTEMEEIFGAIPESLAPAIADVARVFENILLAGLNGNHEQAEIIAEIAGLYVRQLFTFFAGTVYNQFWITRTGTYSAGGEILILTVEDEPVTFTRKR